ncbi:MAG: NAD(P)H-dependent glycerol-3-phosphate dehydrogenase [Gemmataceae bacterium]
MPRPIAILGAGAWGTALAIHLVRKNLAEVRLWVARTDSFTPMKLERCNTRLLPGVAFPAGLHLTDSVEEAVAGAGLVVNAVPTAYLRAACERWRPHYEPNVPIVSLTKGIENRTFERPTQILQEILKSSSVAVLSGPTHAEEVARGQPTSVVVASHDAHLAAEVQNQFASDRLRIYTNGDLVGVELAGALKNVMGIAAGICDGLGFGDNAKAALLTRGLVEMTRFGVAHGAEPATFQGLAGVGDLITTCFSPHGRNRRLGERIAKGESLAQILAGPQVAEGVNTARSVAERCAAMGIEAPIMQAVAAVVHAGAAPKQAVQELMARQQRPETPFGG